MPLTIIIATIVILVVLGTLTYVAWLLKSAVREFAPHLPIPDEARNKARRDHCSKEVR